MSFEWRTVIISWLLKSIGERGRERAREGESIKEEGEREGVRNLGTISICM